MLGCLRTRRLGIFRLKFTLAIARASRESRLRWSRFRWRAHSCVPRRDSSRRMVGGLKSPGVGKSAGAARTSACATMLLLAVAAFGADERVNPALTVKDIHGQLQKPFEA